MGKDLLRAIFVARKPLLSQLVGDIRASALGGERHHNLIVGPRGMGKTLLASMIYYAVKDDLELYSQLRVAWLREEEWFVFSWADLLFRIFVALAAEYEDLRDELTAFAEILRRKPVDEGEREGVVKLREVLGDRTLLLIAENFDDLFDNLDGDAGLLTDFLQSGSRAALLATAPTLTPKLSASDLFAPAAEHVIYLEELTVRQARRLLFRIARNFHHDDDLARYLVTPEAMARLKVIEALAGGHPRIWILFSQILNNELLDSLVSLFIKMLDDLTPYYQERMHALPAQERRMAAFLCENKGGVPVGEIAEACRLAPNACAALLGKLVTRGYVRKAEIDEELSPESTGDRRSVYYEMREPLMRLCLQVKESRDRPIALIVDFLRSWFTPEELRARLSAIDAERSPVTHAYYTASSGDGRALQSAITEAGAGAEANRYGPDISLELAEIFDEADRLYIRRAYVESFNFLFAAKKRYPANALLIGKLGSTSAALEKHEESQEYFRQAFLLNANSAPVWNSRGTAFSYAGKYDEALASYDCAIQIDENFADAWNNRGTMLHNLKRYDEVLSSYDHAIRIDENFNLAWNNRGTILHNLKRYDEALVSYDRAIQIDENYASAWNGRGNALGRLNRYDEALTSFDHAINIDQNFADAWHNRRFPLNSLGRTSEAADSLTIALAIPFSETVATQAAARAALFGDISAALASLRDVFTADEGDKDGQSAAASFLLRALLKPEVNPTERIDAIKEIAAISSENGKIAVLSNSLTRTLSTLLRAEVSVETAQEWEASWHDLLGKNPDAEIALRLLRAAVQWKQTRDRGSLLRLASEERNILEGLIKEANAADAAIAKPEKETIWGKLKSRKAKK